MRWKLCGLGYIALSLAAGNSLYAVGTTGAEFLRTEVPASAAALAAGTAASGGSESLTWNPAGILGSRYPLLSFTHFASLADTAYEQLEGLYPNWLSGSWALRLFYASTYNFMEVDALGEEVGALNNHDLLLHLAYATRLGAGWEIGTGLKLFESVLAEFDSQGIALDLGMRWQTPWEPLALGLAIQNVGTMSAFDQEADPLPTVLSAGMGVTALVWPEHTVKFFADVFQPLQGDEITTLAVGLEYNLSQVVFLRGGYRFLDELGTLSIGGGMRYAGLLIDYAYQPFENLGGNHRFTLAYVFEEQKGKSAEPVLAAKPQPAATPTSLKDLTTDVSELKALPRKYEGKVVFLLPENLTPPKQWELLVLNDQRQKVRAFQGTSVPEQIIWDGRDDAGQTLSGEQPYAFSFTPANAIKSEHALPYVPPALKLAFNRNLQLEPWVHFYFRVRPEIQNWKITIWDSQTDQNVTSCFSLGELPADWTWNGQTLSGQLTDSTHKYSYSLEVTYTDGFKTISSGNINPILARAVEAPKSWAGILIVGILFDFDQAELKPEITDKLLMAAELLKHYPGQASAICEGHADEIGTLSYNQKLSEKRAHMVAHFIAQQPGISADQLSIIGFGKTQPEDTSGTEAARAQNRRVEIRIFIPQAE